MTEDPVDIRPGSWDQKEAGESRKLGRTEQGRRVTSYDVAKAAGVSQSAVSRCYKPGGYVSAKMRTKIMKVAGELGFQPNAIARIMTDSPFQYGGSNYQSYLELLLSRAVGSVESPLR